MHKSEIILTMIHINKNTHWLKQDRSPQFHLDE